MIEPIDAEKILLFLQVAEYARTNPEGTHILYVIRFVSFVFTQIESS